MRKIETPPRDDRTYDPGLLAALDALDLPAAALSEGEFGRIYEAARAGLPRLPQAAAPRRAHTARRWLVRVGGCAAACVVALSGLNLAAPALAEGLPLVGGAFAWANRLMNLQLHSEQLDNYAAPVDATAETSADAADTVTLSQAYFDGDWLRLSVVLEDADGSLAGFDEIAPIHPAQRADPAAWPDDREGYGDLVLADGRLLGNEGYPAFARQDENTWVLVLNYPVFLESDPAALAGQELTLVLRDLVAYNKENVVDAVDEYGHRSGQWEMANPTDLPGVYTMTFTVPAADEAGVRTASGADEASGVTVESLRATPAATRLTVTAPNTPPDSEGESTLSNFYDFALALPDGTPLKLERGEGAPVDETCTAYRYTYYFDAVPETVSAVTLTVLRDGVPVTTIELPLA